jgi:hypothetical protein
LPIGVARLIGCCGRNKLVAEQFQSGMSRIEAVFSADEANTLLTISQ